MIARGAGEILASRFGNEMKIDHKGTIDLVTEMDHKSEEYIVRKIRDKFPTHKLLTEESGGFDGDDEHMWIIDPLDGTVNYAHGIPIYSVSIAYAHKGRVTLGVVHDPAKDECFSAERGAGAFLNEKPIRVSNQADLSQSLLVTGFHYDIRTNVEKNLDHYEYFALRTQGVRRLGSAAIDLCYVAAGRFDGYWELLLNAWDVAAGGLIAEEAGAKVSNIAGKTNYLDGPVSILAANPDVFSKIGARFWMDN